MDVPGIHSDIARILLYYLQVGPGRCRTDQFSQTRSVQSVGFRSTRLGAGGGQPFSSCPQPVSRGRGQGAATPPLVTHPAPTPPSPGLPQQVVFHKAPKNKRMERVLGKLLEEGQQR